MIRSPLPDLVIHHREHEDPERTPSAPLMRCGSEPICNQHLEGQRNDLSYVTAGGGSGGAAGGVQTLMQEFTRAVDT